MVLKRVQKKVQKKAQKKAQNKIQKNLKKEILYNLAKGSVGILGTYDNQSNKIKQRIMYYGLDKKFNLFLMSSKNSPKMNQILLFPEVSFIVYSLENPYDNSWEIEVEGKVSILKDEKEINAALIILKDRNPFANVTYESSIINQFNFIHLNPKIVKFSIYGKTLKGIPPYILQL